jgi:hypothetical protein
LLLLLACRSAHFKHQRTRRLRNGTKKKGRNFSADSCSRPALFCR